MGNIVIATRESRLALWQAHHVKACLEQQGHRVELLGMTTRGDQILDRSLSKVGGKGLFVKELEVALEEGRADIAVHSLKDLPTYPCPGIRLVAVPGREDPRDVVVARDGLTLGELPPGSRIGTGSPRRVAQLHALDDDRARRRVAGDRDGDLAGGEGVRRGVALRVADLDAADGGGARERLDLDRLDLQSQAPKQLDRHGRDVGVVR